MATKKMEDITIAVPEKEQAPEEVRVMIRLPKKEDDDNPGITVDQYEHVTISNEKGTNHIRIKRGEPVEVTIPVFEQLKKRYPNI